MARYIDADKFIKDLQSEYHGMISDESMKIYKIIHRLDNEPTADVVRVEEARWKGAGMGDYYCSLCQETVSGNKFKYCPYCGAKMNGGESDE